MLSKLIVLFVNSQTNDSLECKQAKQCHKQHYASTLYLIPPGRVVACLKYEPLYESIFFNSCFWEWAQTSLCNEKNVTELSTATQNIARSFEVPFNLQQDVVYTFVLYSAKAARHLVNKITRPGIRRKALDFDSNLPSSILLKDTKSGI